jgi:hypothetical protein
VATRKEFSLKKHGACVEPAVEHVFHRVGREEVPLSGAETITVEYLSDLPVRSTSGPRRKCLSDGLALAWLDDRNFTRGFDHIAEWHRPDRKPSFRLMSLRFQDMHGDLVGEELVHDTDHVEMELPW